MSVGSGAQGLASDTAQTRAALNRNALHKSALLWIDIIGILSPGNGRHWRFVKEKSLRQSINEKIKRE
jgi:hypothetical protein